MPNKTHVIWYWYSPSDSFTNHAEDEMFVGRGLSNPQGEATDGGLNPYPWILGTLVLGTFLGTGIAVWMLLEKTFPDEKRKATLAQRKRRAEAKKKKQRAAQRKRRAEAKKKKVDD